MILNRLSLRAQLNFVILLVLSLSFTGSVWINVTDSQSFLSKQLKSHALDTATSLGLALSAPLAEDDKYLVESTINAIFDHGYYQHITLKTINGELIYQRVQSNQPEQIPDWFTHLFILKAPVERSMIDTGWVIGGVLTVQSHTGTAYEQLWESAYDVALFTLIIFTISLLLGYLILKEIYRPINEISQHAELVNQGEFTLIERIPRAIELRNVVVAMNHMISNLKSTFTELTEDVEKTRKSAYIDVQTGIRNRRAFNDSIDSLLSKSMQFQGHLGMLRITPLIEINKQLGYQVGDQLINDVVTIFTDMESHVRVYRISGSEFAFLIENQQSKVIRNIAQNIVHALDQIKPALKNVQTERVFALGIVKIKSEDILSQIMYQLDLQTNKSIHALSGYCLNETKIDQLTYKESATSFKNKIDQILSEANDSITLKTQTVRKFTQEDLFDGEIFASFSLNGEPVNTGEVFSFAEQFNLSGPLDVAIIKKALDHLLNNRNEKLALSLSSGTYNDLESMDKIMLLLKKAKINKRLVIQIMEQNVLNDVQKAKRIIQKFTKLGCLTCINRFGGSIESLHYLIDIRPDYVKLSPHFTTNVDTKEENASLVSAFVRTAHGLNTPIIANCVETQAELDVLETLKIDGALGYAIDKPEIK